VGRLTSWKRGTSFWRDLSLTVFLIVLLVYAIYSLLFLPYGVRHRYELSYRYTQLKKKVRKLEEQCREIAERNRLLSCSLDRNALEDAVRLKLGYTRPQEWVILLPLQH
jgi:cell division protein FtsB